MLAAEFAFVQPPQRSIQIISDRSEGRYLITLSDRAAALPGFQKLPFRRTQWAAIKNGHSQFIYLPEVRLDLNPKGDQLNVFLSGGKLPPFTAVPELGSILMKDFESAMDIADRILREETATSLA